MKKASFLIGIFITVVMLSGPTDEFTGPKQLTSGTKQQTEKQVTTFDICEDESTIPVLPNQVVALTPTLPNEPTTESPASVPSELSERIPITESIPEPIESVSVFPSVQEADSVAIRSGSSLPGFDHVPYAGPNIAITAEYMFENGNKIGIMD